MKKYPDLDSALNDMPKFLEFESSLKSRNRLPIPINHMCFLRKTAGLVIGAIARNTMDTGLTVYTVLWYAGRWIFYSRV